MGDAQRALNIAAAAIYDHHPALKVQGIAHAWIDATETARGALRALADDGWTVVGARLLADLERERDELLAELRAVERQRDRLLEERVAETVGGPGEGMPWPLDCTFPPPLPAGRRLQGLPRPGGLLDRLQRATPADDEECPRV